MTVIGLMSGTSLDGLDICCAQFTYADEKYSFEILASETIKYLDETRGNLENAFHFDKEKLDQLHLSYGEEIGEEVNRFIQKHQLKNKVDLIGSHGHTIFHEPEKGVTVQIGDGQKIADKTGIPVINDFRIKDVQLGGQGAPLVPIGDLLLFSAYQACLNLGGISNISFDWKGERIAFDIGPANMPINQIMKEEFRLEYDENGDKARSGKVNSILLEKLSQLPYYSKSFPKSLGREWIEQEFFPIIKEFKIPTEDILKTIVEHETDEIIRVFQKYDLQSCLVTGGGTHNSFFIERLKAKSKTEIIIPDKETIEFKEALIFAFLAYLNWNDQINTLKSVTGASRDSIGGIQFFL